MALPGKGLRGAGAMPRLWGQNLMLGRNLDGARWKEPSWGPWRSEGCWAEGLCFTSLPTRPSDPREPRPSSWENPHQDL